MEERLLVTASPHIRDHSTTRGLMGYVVIALLPCVPENKFTGGGLITRRQNEQQ